MSCVDVNPECVILEGEPRVEMGPARRLELERHGTRMGVCFRRSKSGILNAVIALAESLNYTRAADEAPHHAIRL